MADDIVVEEARTSGELLDAASRGYLKAVTDLLRDGVEVDGERDTLENTALHLSSAAGHTGQTM